MSRKSQQKKSCKKFHVEKCVEQVRPKNLYILTFTKINFNFHFRFLEEFQLFENFIFN